MTMMIQMDDPLEHLRNTYFKFNSGVDCIPNAQKVNYPKHKNTTGLFSRGQFLLNALRDVKNFTQILLNLMKQPLILFIFAMAIGLLCKPMLILAKHCSYLSVNNYTNIKTILQDLILTKCITGILFILSS